MREVHDTADKTCNVHTSEQTTVLTVTVIDVSPLILTIILHIGRWRAECSRRYTVDKYAEQYLVNGTNHVTITDFPEGTNTTLDKPLTVWALVAPGTYENFVVEISNADMTISTPVKGPFVVEKCAICENICEAQEVKYDNGIGDFEGENGEFNPKN